MALQRTTVDPRIVKGLAAVIVGLGVGWLLQPEPVALPYVGALPSLLVGGVGLLGGLAVYRFVPPLVGSSCGCTGDCGCS